MEMLTARRTRQDVILVIPTAGTQPSDMTPESDPDEFGYKASGRLNTAHQRAPNVVTGSATDRQEQACTGRFKAVGYGPQPRTRDDSSGASSRATWQRLITPPGRPRG
jgi:hypothetical protein